MPLALSREDCTHLLLLIVEVSGSRGFSPFWGFPRKFGVLCAWLFYLLFVSDCWFGLLEFGSLVYNSCPSRFVCVKGVCLTSPSSPYNIIGSKN